MPKEYIEREKALNAISRGLGCGNICSQSINRIPTADVVEVVRCKDCKFHTDEEPGMVYCPAVLGNWVNDDWFCKDGEREDEE